MNVNTNYSMKPDTSHNIGSFQTIGLLACLFCGLSALNAQGQTPVRRTAPYRTTYYSGQASVYSPYGPYLGNPPYLNNPYYLNNLPMPYANTPQNTFSTASGSTLGRTNPLAAQSLGGVSSQQQAPATVTAQYTDSNELLVQWSGNTNGIRQVTLGLFDSSGQMLASRVITQLPVMAHFAVTGTARYYGAQVTAVNGKITNVYQPLP